jgi:hypothetical protein
VWFGPADFHTFLHTHSHFFCPGRMWNHILHHELNTSCTLRVRTRSMHCLMMQKWEHQHWRMIIRRRQRMSIWNCNLDRFGHPPPERVLQGRGRGLA